MRAGITTIFTDRGLCSDRCIVLDMKDRLSCSDERLKRCALAEFDTLLIDLPRNIWQNVGDYLLSVELMDGQYCWRVLQPNRQVSCISFLREI